MSTPSQNNDNLSQGGYNVERLDNMSERVARIEGRMESAATKEDVANVKTLVEKTKYDSLRSWIAIGVAVLVGLISILVRFWPSGSVGTPAG